MPGTLLMLVLKCRDFASGPVAKTPKGGGLGLISGQETRSNMPQLRPSTVKQIN